MDTASQTRDMPALEMRGAFQTSTVDREKRTVEITWTTGARVLRGFWEPYYEELSLDAKHVRMERLSSGRAPFLMDHENRVHSVAGVIEKAWLMKAEGRALVRFLKQGVDAEVDSYFERVADGVAPNVSVGYRVHKLVKAEAGDGKLPVMRAEDWEPLEVSGVAIGADAGASTRSANATGSNPCEFITRGAEPLNKENVVPEPEKKSPPAGVDVAEATRAAIQAERQRAADIHALVRTARLDAALADTLVSEAKTVDEARAVVLEKVMERSSAHGPSQTPSGAVEVAMSERDKRVRGMTAWALERAGLSDVIERAQQDAKHGRRLKDTPLDGGEFRGMRLLDMARECLERAGVRTRGMDPMALVGLAFTHRTGGMQTTSDFAVLFENVMNKVVLAAYVTTPDTWSLFAATTTVSDFRPSSRYRPGSLGELDAVNEHGEFKNKAIPDGEKFSVSTGTKGNIIALTRQAIINDDMGALADLATKLGRAARLSIELDVYRLLTANNGLGPTMADGNPFFHASRGNINATGSALSVAGLDADRVVLSKQKDPGNNEFLDLRPSVLVLPVGLGGDARVLNGAEYDTDTAGKFQRPNKVRGLFGRIVDTPRLDGTRRYLFVDPGIAPAITVAFLEGQGEAPVVESMDGWRVDGTEWKVRLDVKAQATDPRGAVTNAGV